MEHLDFVPHKVCWLYRSDIIWAHAIGDGMTAISYFMIPILLFYLARTYQLDWRLRFIFIVYGTFVSLCGTTHVFDVVMIWRISERLLLIDGIVRVITGIFSLFSAVITLWAVTLFLELIGRVLSMSIKMTTERLNRQRVSEKTWSEFITVVDEASNFLRNQKTE